VQRVIVNSEQIEANCLTLTPEQSHYLHRVLRLGVGDQCLVGDGQGTQWTATLGPTLGLATLSAMPPPAPEPVPPIAITLAAALPKQGFDEVVRQVTELGVSRIVPILSDRTLLKPSGHKLDRWRRIATEAAEQSERPYVPTVDAPVPWLSWVRQPPSSDLRWLCVARQNCPHLLAQGQQDWPFQTVTLAIGPEGGWADSEVAAASTAGYQSVSLGPGILRAVTAPIVAIALIHGIHQFARIDPSL
jgi:16S rRNA (uracil1498-N3)-methyltransferase